MRPLGSPRRTLEAVPALKSLHPGAARWIGALIRMTSPHPAMTRILDVIERLGDRPYRTNFVLLGEPGTGKEGLGRALAHLSCPGGPLVRYDVAGFPEDEALDVLCGTARRPGVAEAADGGAILIEEVAGLGPRVQAALLRLLKTGRCEHRGGAGTRVDVDADDDARAPERVGDRGAASSARRGRRLDVQIVATSARDLLDEVRRGRLRHDLYYRLARVVLWLPPLRERIEDIGPAAIWMGNRVLRAAGVPLDLMGMEELARASRDEKARAIALGPDAIAALEAHPWPGNLRELEAVLERALLLYRDDARGGKAGKLGAAEIGAALADPGGGGAPAAGVD